MGQQEGLMQILYQFFEVRQWRRRLLHELEFGEACLDRHRISLEDLFQRSFGDLGPDGRAIEFARRPDLSDVQAELGRVVGYDFGEEAVQRPESHPVDGLEGLLELNLEEGLVPGSAVLPGGG